MGVFGLAFPFSRRHSIILTILASLCLSVLFAVGLMATAFYSGTAMPGDDLWNTLFRHQAQRHHKHTYRHVLIKSMIIGVRTVSEPQLFIFKDRVLMGEICGRSELSNYSNQVL